MENILSVRNFVSDCVFKEIDKAIDSGNQAEARKLLELIALKALKVDEYRKVLMDLEGKKTTTTPTEST